MLVNDRSAAVQHATTNVRMTVTQCLIVDKELEEWLHVLRGERWREKLEGARDGDSGWPGICPIDALRNEHTLLCRECHIQRRNYATQLLTYWSNSGARTFA